MTSTRLDMLANMSRAELERIFVRGGQPQLEALAGWQFSGWNCPRLARLAGIRKFVKGFYWNQDRLYGYNCAVRQNERSAPWLSKDGAFAERFGYYRVAAVDACAKDNQYLNAVLLDYGAGDNKSYDPTRNLRDYLVQVDADNPDLFLGKAYYALGPLRVPANFFLLQRLQESSR